MGCRYRTWKMCYPLTCCCCVEIDEACWWIGAVGVVWCAVATLVDFISAHLPWQYCDGCLDHHLQRKLSLAAGCVNAVQCLASVLLLQGARRGNKWLLLAWLAWSVVSLVMLVVWVVVTAPHMPSLRGLASLLQLVWGLHYFLVVRTQYCILANKFSPPEEAPLTVPPNTPTRRHKRWRRRLDPGCQPAIRILLGAALRLHREVLPDKEEEQDEEDEDVAIRVVVGRDREEEEEREEEHQQTCYRRRGRRTATPAGENLEDRPETDPRTIILHTADRDVRRVADHRTHRTRHHHHRADRQWEAIPDGEGGEAVPMLLLASKRSSCTSIESVLNTRRYSQSPSPPTDTPPPTISPSPSSTIPPIKSSHRD